MIVLLKSFTVNEAVSTLADNNMYIRQDMSDGAWELVHDKVVVSYHWTKESVIRFGLKKINKINEQLDTMTMVTSENNTFYMYEYPYQD